MQPVLSEEPSQSPPGLYIPADDFVDIPEFQLHEDVPNATPVSPRVPGSTPFAGQRRQMRFLTPASPSHVPRVLPSVRQQSPDERLPAIVEPVVSTTRRSRRPPALFDPDLGNNVSHGMLIPMQLTERRWLTRTVFV